MHKSKKELYELVSDIITEKEFEKKINQKRKECDGLFDDDTIALFIIDELGRNKENISCINGLKPGNEATIYGKIMNIDESRNFKRKNGSTGKVVNLEITDNTGSCYLVLWDKDVELVRNQKIKTGTNVKVVNGYIKDGIKGLEINIGRWGMINIEPDDMPILDKKITSDLNKLKGTITEIQSTRPFFRETGDYGFVTNITIDSNKGIKNLVLWDEKVKEIQKFSIGDKISIENYDVKNKNGISELHVNGKAKISYV